MTTDEIKTEENTDVIQKSEDSSLISLVTELVRKQDSRIDEFEKRFDTIETLIKEANANPVDSGLEAENKPKVEDANDVGDKVTIGNEVAPKPSDAQASIIAPAVETSESDKDGLKMENKADDDDDKKEEKKEDVAKTDDDKEEDKKEDKEEKVEKSIKDSDDFEYEIVKTVRPAGLNQVPSDKKYPTGYQILKSIINGWDGKTSSVEQSLTIAYDKLEKGEFGDGFPNGGVY